MKYDAIVIGSGLGGLTAGAKLSKEGKKILLIEQHVIPGGCATTFKRKNFNIEVGLHEMDGLHKKDPKSKIFEDLGVFDNVEFVKVPEFYRYISHRVDIVIPNDYRKAVDVLVKRFPNEKKGIRKFFKVIMRLNKELNRFPKEKWKTIALFPFFPILYLNIMLRENGTLGDFLDTIIEDEELKLVLIANLSYYHDNPYTMSLLFYAAAQGSYYSGGGHFIKGGSQKLSNYLKDVIENNGGKVLFRHLVTAIITKDNRAVGVRYRKTPGSDTETQEVHAQYIVANAAVPNVVNELLPPSEGKNRLSEMVNQKEVACSLLSVYLGFKKSPKILGNRHYSTFVANENVSNQTDWVEKSRSDWSERGFVFVDYSQIDSQLTSKDKGVGVICTFDDISDWKRLSKQEYRAKKETVAQVLIDRLNNLIPGIKEEIEYCEVGTSKTIKRYTLNPKGTAYGFSQIPNQAGRKRIPQKAPVENLFFASAWTVPGHGFTGAIMSGYWCAQEILKI